MAKKITDPKEARLQQIARALLREADELRGPRTIHESLGRLPSWAAPSWAAIKDLPKGQIPKTKLLEELEKQNREQRAALEQEAKELFERISRKLGSKEAKEIFIIASKRPRGSKYGTYFDSILRIHAIRTGSPTRTARTAIKLGLQVGEEALIKHIQVLRRKRRKRPAAERDK
jgi:hypothetical protein